MQCNVGTHSIVIIILNIIRNMGFLASILFQIEKIILLLPTYIIYKTSFFNYMNINSFIDKNTNLYLYKLNFTV